MHRLHSTLHSCFSRDSLRESFCNLANIALMIKRYHKVNDLLDRATYGDGMRCIFCSNFVNFPPDLSRVSCMGCPYCDNMVTRSYSSGLSRSIYGFHFYKFILWLEVAWRMNFYSVFVDKNCGSRTQIHTQSSRVCNMRIYTLNYNTIHCNRTYLRPPGFMNYYFHINISNFDE